MKITPTIAKKKLNSAISAISNISWMYSKDPESDFRRERKLPMDSILRMLLKFSGKVCKVNSLPIILHRKNHTAAFRQNPLSLSSGKSFYGKVAIRYSGHLRIRCPASSFSTDTSCLHATALLYVFPAMTRKNYTLSQPGKNADPITC